MHVKETQRSRATKNRGRKNYKEDWILYLIILIMTGCWHDICLSMRIMGRRCRKYPCYHICINRLGYISIIWLPDGNERCASGTKRTCNLRVGNKVKAIPIYVALTVTSYRSFCQLFVFNERPLRFLELYGSLSREAYLLFTFAGVPLLPYLGVMPNKTQSKMRITFFGNPE